MHKKKLTILGILILFLVLFTTISAAFKFSPFLFQLFFNKDIDLKKTPQNTINILFLGVGGGDHEGPNLTDTIMVAHIDPRKNKVSFISLPRDLWVFDLKGKVNTAYAIGEYKQTGGGLILSKAIVSKVLNIPIDYAVRVDFDGFVKAVDFVEGLDVDVERSFDDYRYPIEEKRADLCGHTLELATALIATMEATLVFPCRYEHIHFEKGLQRMDGKRALVFVRSRYAEGEEGTDFARTMRQQRVIKAFREKILSIGTLLNPIKVANLYGILEKSIDSDIHPSEIDDFIKLGQKMQGVEINSFVIEEEIKADNKKGLLINPPLADFSGTWVLIPRIGEKNYKEIQEYVQCILTKDTCPIQ